MLYDAILKEELDLLAQTIKANISQTGQRASGKTQASIQVNVTDSHGVITGRKPFGTLETGRKAGVTPFGFVAIIRQWMQDKGIKATPIPYVRKPSDKWQPKYSAEERGALSIAGAIAHKIRTQGTRLYRDGGRSDVYSEPIRATLESLRKRISREMVIQTIKINGDGNKAT